MDYALEVLTEKLEDLQRAYDEHVVRGNVKENDKYAILNRNRHKSCKIAISKLTNR